MIRRVLRAPVVVVAAALALVLPGCGFFGGDELTVRARFRDVIDLVPDASVRVGNVPVGLVKDIQLTDDNLAEVTFTVAADADLPSDTRAILAKTSLLGERFIELEPTGQGGSLEDGQLIEDTLILSDFEDLVAAGGDTLSFLAADRLAAAIQTGAAAFGGRGSLIGQFISDTEVFLGRYADGGEVLVRLIDSLDRLTQTLAPATETNADAIVALERFGTALQEEDTRLLDALDQVVRLADVGERILSEHGDQMTDAIRRLRIVLNELTRIDGALDRLLVWGARHNKHVANGSVEERAQVWLDFILCGTEEQGNPSIDCTPPNPGQHAEEPPYHPNSEACMEDPDNCPRP